MTYPRSYRLSLSMGLASCDPASACTLEELLSRADASMYEKKCTIKAGLDNG